LIDDKLQAMKLSKLDIARQQLDTATRLFVGGEDQLAVHTLSGAAEEILGSLLERAGQQNIFERMRIVAEERMGKTISVGELSTLVNSSRNSLKHA
jgi:hypothetical protein